MRYFHVSRKYLGINPIFKPKVPESCCISGEGDIPRICVTTSVFLCFRAISGRSKITLEDILIEFRGHNPVVYYSEELPFLPPDASDFRYNDEHWYLKNTKFKLLGYVNMVHLCKTGKISVTRENIKFNRYSETFDQDLKIRKHKHKELFERKV